MNDIFLTDQLRFSIKTVFEERLKEHRFSFKCNTNGVYNLSQKNDNNHTLTTQLICSESIDETKLGSRNGNVIQSIGKFKLEFPTGIDEANFAVLAFQNTKNHVIELIIIPFKGLTRRLFDSHGVSTDKHDVEIVFWLMPDNQLYADLGIEGEWYYLSKGPHGRMVDGTVWDYSNYLNAWDRLKIV